MPTIDIPDKICSHCGDIKWDIKYYQNGKIKSTYCSNKRLENEKNRRIKNHDKIYIQQKIWAQKNIDKCREAVKNYHLRNKDSRASYMKNHMKKPEVRENIKRKVKERIAKLTDGIVRNMIKHQFSKDILIKASEILPELIELKRKQLLLIRKSKQNGKN
jgi:hypothetical protein